MQENIILDDDEQNNNYQVLITGLTWNKDSLNAYASKKDKIELPTQFTLDVPETILKKANKKNNNFNDVIESFIYNFLTKKFRHEVYSCQIWLPLDK